VGRDRELELLLDGMARAREGTGQVFSIIGEAGVGKSRFLYEFRKAVSTEDITFLEGKCLSYSKGVPYHPIIDILKGNFNIGEEDADEGVRKKVRNFLKLLKADEASILPYLLELLGVADPGIDRLQTSPEGIKDRILASVRQILVMGSQIRPLVIAIEDLHWTDNATEDTLKWLLESVPGARVLIIFTYRPEFVHAWEGRSYHNRITLNRLSNRESLLVASHLLGTDDVAPELQKLILEKTEGVPFFIEESIKSLQEMGVIKKEGDRVLIEENFESITIPPTVQDMIMARVDRLSDGAKAVLQAGATIEREFSGDLIREVTGLPESQLLTHLSALKDAELLYERGITPRISYIFRHALTREVVYESILSRRRRELHARIGASIEKIYKTNLGEYYEILSDHFALGGDFARAADYAKLASRKAEKNASLTDAIPYARKRISYLDRLHDAKDGWKNMIDARTVLGLYLSQINRWAEAGEAVAPVVRLAREKDYRKRLGQIQSVMGCYHGFIEENIPKALQALEESLRIASEENDIITLILTNMWLGVMNGFNCDFAKTRASIQRSVDINLAAKSLWGIASMKAQLAYFGHYWPGQIYSLAEISSEALKVAEESGDPISRGMAHTTYGTCCYAKGKLKDAENRILEGKSLHERIGMYGWASLGNISLAETYFAMKAYRKSSSAFSQALRLYESGRMQPSSVRAAKLGAVRCGVLLGERDVDLESLRVVPEKNRFKLLEGSTSRMLGDILLNLGGSQLAESERWMQKAIEADSGNGMKFNLGMDHALYGELFAHRGYRDRAREQFGKAAEVMRGCGADGWVEKYRKEMALLA
jgi:tetratricopeptide (TPR) repeat protein